MRLPSVRSSQRASAWIEIQHARRVEEGLDGLHEDANGALSGIMKLPDRWTAAIQKEGDYIEG